MPSEVPDSAASMSWTARALPGQDHVDEAQADEVAEILAATGMDDHRPGDEGDLPPRARVSRSIAATRVTATSTRRSDDTSLLMKPKVGLSRPCRSGRTRMPCMPHTTRSPAFRPRSLRHSSRSASTTMAASIRCRSTGRHCPPMSTCVRWLVVE